MKRINWFNTWCNPVGINKRSANPYKNNPNGPDLLITVPKPSISILKNGHTKYETIATNGTVKIIIIGTKRLPAKKLNATGNFCVWNLL